MTRFIATKSRFLLIASCLVFVTGCNALNRISSIGQEPQFTAIENPTTKPNYKPISMPMPAPVLAVHNPNSLWRKGSRAFFKDQRASQVGDIVSVTIAVDDQADIENETTRTRTTDEDADAIALLGYQGALNSILPEAVNPNSLLDINSTSTNTGTGTIERNEQITLQVAAIVTQVLPNGNLVLHGRQEMRVNFEVREIQIAGVIRPQDITNENTVTHQQIAELRVAYGGRGQISDFQQPRYGTQIIDILFPF